MSTPPLARIAVGVVVERRAATSPWIEHVWRPVGLLAGVPETAAWTPVPGAAGLSRTRPAPKTPVMPCGIVTPWSGTLMSSFFARAIRIS